MILQKFKLLAAKINEPMDRVGGKLTIKNKTFSAVFKLFVFVLSVHLLFITVGVYKFLPNRPDSIHSSAQCQRASVALNYYENDMNFFEPRIQRYVTGEGITGLEFPIIYYTAAVLYKLFGFNEIFLKIINIIIVVFGFFLFYKLCLNYIKNSFLVILFVGSAVLSPVLLFYTANFLPDAPSLGFILAAWYFLFKYLRSGRNNALNLFVFFGILAALIKAVAVLCFFVVISLIILDSFKFFRQKNNLQVFQFKSKVLFRMGVGFCCIFLWYFYAHYLTVKYNNPAFALSPIMVDSWKDFLGICDSVINYWGLQYYSYEAYVLMLSALVIVLLTCKMANKLLLSVTVLNILGSMVYVFFFTNQFRHHDYYIIAMLPSVFFLLLTFGDIIYRISVNYFRPVILILSIILFFNMKESIVNCKENYYDRNLYQLTILARGDYRPYYDLEPVLRKLGIKRTDKVLSGDDHTYCSSLYLMNQLGTVFSKENHSPGDVKQLLRTPEIKYLILNDSTDFVKIYETDLSDKIIACHRGLIIYKLR